MKPVSTAQLRDLIARRGDCELVGNPDQLVGPDVVRSSQDATAGSLFVAIRGERLDGHDFAADAVAAGVRCLLVERHLDLDVPQLIVPDTQSGLQWLAAAIIEDRLRAGTLTTFALTGSSGKTSTKDLLAQVLASFGPTVAPQGSYNNEIGVPLTACRVDEDTRYLVSEMGARTVGDVELLCQIAPPKISTVLNVGVAHLGEFGSRENIANAKGEIFDRLPADGWAVINAQDDFAELLRERVRDNTDARIASWAIDPDSLPTDELVLTASELVADDLDRYRFMLSVKSAGQMDQALVQLKVVGRVQVANALAAATMAFAAGLPLPQIADALSTATNRSDWRMAVESVELPDGEAIIINDAYNANPGSMRAALETLTAIAASRHSRGEPVRTIAVLGDMLELGADAAQIHQDLGHYAAQCGVNELIATGSFGEDLVAGYAGATARNIDRESIATELDLKSGDVVLIKASRGLALEQVAAELAARYRQSEESRQSKADDFVSDGQTSLVDPASKGNGEDRSA